MAKKRSSLSEVSEQVIRAVREKERHPRTAALPARAGAADYTVSAVNLRKSDWRLLRRVAEARSDLHGGRPSVSKVIESMIDSLRQDLQREADQAQ